MPPLAAAIPAIAGGIGSGLAGLGGAVGSGLGAAGAGLGAAASTLPQTMLGQALSGAAMKEGVRQGSNLLAGDPEKQARDYYANQKKAMMAQSLGELLTPKRTKFNASTFNPMNQNNY